VRRGKVILCTTCGGAAAFGSSALEKKRGGESVVWSGPVGVRGRNYCTWGQKLDLLSSEMPLTPIREHDPLNLLVEARQQYTARACRELSVTAKTIARWEKRQTQIPLFVEPALREILRVGTVRSDGSASFTFIDLFAGIGGMRSGFETAGGRCVFTSEWNPWAQKTYRENFGNEEIAGDITLVQENEVPDHDVLLAGFPCQPFSIAEVSKRIPLVPSWFRGETPRTGLDYQSWYFVFIANKRSVMSLSATSLVGSFVSEALWYSCNS
jgi:hypothetical protein